MAERLIRLFLLHFFIFPQAKLECGHGWVQGITTNKCIRAFSELATWEDAEYYCDLWGGHLASVSNAFENAYIAQYASSALNTSSVYWLGGNTLHADTYQTNWTWTDFTTMAYNRFAPIPPSTTPWPGICPTGWEYFNLTQKCYLAVDSNPYSMLNFNDTRDGCRSTFGADLVSIHSKEENEWIVDFLYKQEIGAAWIGLYAPRANGNWQWNDGTPVDYFNWGENEPEQGTYCAYLVSANFPKQNEYKYLWYSDDLEELTAGICVLPAKGSPTQPTQTPTTPQWIYKCDPGWQYYDLMKNCYKNIRGALFDDCRHECQHMGADLATIYSAAENELFSEFIVLSGGSQAWIGLYSPNNDGKFQWIDGSPLNFTAWSAGEPQTGTYGARLIAIGADRGKWSSLHSNIYNDCFCAKNSF